MRFLHFKRQEYDVVFIQIPLQENDVALCRFGTSITGGSDSTVYENTVIWKLQI
jgi:hypothetical protein